MFVQLMTPRQYWPHPGANQFFDRKIFQNFLISFGFCTQVSAFEPLGSCFNLLTFSTVQELQIATLTLTFDK